MQVLAAMQEGCREACQVARQVEGPQAVGPQWKKWTDLKAADREEAERDSALNTGRLGNWNS